MQVDATPRKALLFSACQKNNNYVAARLGAGRKQLPNILFPRMKIENGLAALRK